MTLHSRLKDETQPFHTQLERVADFERLMTPKVVTSDYSHALRKMWGYLSPLELQIYYDEALKRWIPDLEERRRSAYILQDLNRLRVTEPPLAASSSHLPYLPSLAHKMGGLYVLEGSSLGGRIISKHLLDRGVAKPDQLNFFQYDQEKIGYRWKKFLQALQEFSQTHPDQIEIVIESAKDTFKHYKLWMEKPISEFLEES